MEKMAYASTEWPVCVPGAMSIFPHGQRISVELLPMGTCVEKKHIQVTLGEPAELQLESICKVRFSYLDPLFARALDRMPRPPCVLSRRNRACHEARHLELRAASRGILTVRRSTRADEGKARHSQKAPHTNTCSDRGHH